MNSQQSSGGQNFLYFHLPAILYAALIITVSSIPNLHTPRIGVLSSDKLIHACEYAMFGFLFFRSFSRVRAIPGRYAALLTIIFMVIFASGDEFHQRFVRGRSMDIFDLGADMLGGVLTVLWLERRRRRLAAHERD